VGSRDIDASAASVNLAAFDAVVFIPSEPNNVCNGCLYLVALSFKRRQALA